MMEVHAKVIEYEHFLNERLRSDLKKVCPPNTKASSCWDRDRRVGRVGGRMGMEKY